MSVIAWTGNQKRTKETRVISHMHKIKLPASESSPVRFLQRQLEGGAGGRMPDCSNDPRHVKPTFRAAWKTDAT
ncbi:hypothetical protein CY34DRAFT_801863 [Suillus luteus UH-Slu-Lm8-n1]|uniref:Uncharacterized protein n=1 Tax=Suillus luteus UH-Slu-Lm8-n1 TaxID=930992 RepID=A0A0D0A543_9AGAM|nr:hypothetical protein CY34DRAFT_801863 [Suillus luteus UH-Slu-Lm8-n1]